MSLTLSRFKKAAFLLLLLISIPLAIIFFRPEFALHTLLKSSAAQLGFEISSMQVSHLGLNSTSLAKLHLDSDDQQYEISELDIHYSLSDLVIGRVQSLSISKMEVRTERTPDQTVEDKTTTLSWMLETLDELPTDSLVLSYVKLFATGTDNDGYEAEMSLQSPPLAIEGAARLDTLEHVLIEFAVQRTGANSLNILSSALFDDELAFESNINLSVANDKETFALTGTLHMDSLRTRLAQILPASTLLLNDSLLLQSNFEVQELLGDASIAQLNLVLDSPNSLLQITQESDSGSNAMQLRLPISLRGDIATATGEIQLTLSELFGSGSQALENATSQSEHTFENTQLHCTSFTSCDMQSDWRSSFSSWHYGEYLGANTSVTAPLRFNYSNDEMRLAADVVQVSVPSITGPRESEISELSTNFQLDEVEFRAGDMISGGFNFSSSEFRLDNNIADIRNPAYSGKLQLEEDILTGILEIDLDQRLRLGIGLQHFFLRDTGDVVLQLGAYQFTEAEPLSALISPKGLDADIVAGQIEGLANISWSKQLDDSWRFGGPVALKLEQLSGYYADYFFVDLNTDLFGEATTPLGIQVTNPASASLSRIDIGLPLEELSWQYRFNTLTREVQLIDFNAALLGGKLSIPAARYNPTRDRQQVDVVIADVRVDSLVNLAKYPELQADGLLSGYIPFIIEGDTFSIEKGLVSALRPGGSIRYTPTNSGPSSNQSLRLVNDALANYQYQVMNTDVSYGADGELLLNVQLQGSNPDMNNGQAINLNVNITDNIPSLLKSLQASRVITDELERLVSRP